jgi:hypothetical protein
MPRSIFSRASVENLTSLAAIVFLPRQLLVFMLPLITGTVRVSAGFALRSVS